ncbi:MAG: Carbonic anhydrase, beta class [Firmicutes bacterium]|nr:Carbonic anhydrase, beta class [Bacillota bacterium]MDI6705707.1 carbonic anhydrase [Bacillota bacterium]
MLEEILSYNRSFVEERRKEGKDKKISGHAQKEAMIFTCMDTRLVGLVEDAMGFKRGEVKVLKNAGNTIRDNCDDVIRSISLGILMMGIKEVFVVGHKDCGMKKLTGDKIAQAMRDRGIDENAIASVDLEKWAGVINNEAENVAEVVAAIKNSKFIPKDVAIHGLMIDPDSGELEEVQYI